MQTRSDNQLENLTEEQRSFILEMAGNARLNDVVLALKEHNIHISASTLSRFLKRHREKLLLEEAADSKETVKALAESGRDGALREGTLEAVRHRLYERALACQTPEEAQQLYRAMVAEEAKLKELELEAKKVAIAQEQLVLQRMRLESDNRKRVKGTVTNSEPVVEVPATPAQLAAPSNHEKQLVHLFSETLEILNRGGEIGDRIIEARARLAAGVQLLPGGA